jgi:hypothetical protein
MAAGLLPTSWIFENLKDAGNSPLVSEVVHQISKRSDKWLKSYPNFKKIKMAAGLRPPSWIF